MQASCSNFLLIVIGSLSLLELLICLILHFSTNCEPYRSTLTFVEFSGLLGVLSTCSYLALKHLHGTYPMIYLILSNVYFVSMICAGLYWLVHLVLESRDFADRTDRDICGVWIKRFMLSALIANAAVFVLLLFSLFWIHHHDRLTRPDFYVHTTLIPT